MAKISLEQARQLVERASDAVVVELADNIERLARERTPRDEGVAAAGWGQQEVAGGGVRVMNRVPYIRVLEFGQRFGRLKKDGTVSRLERPRPPHHMLTAAVNVAKRLVPSIVANLGQGKTRNARRRAIRNLKTIERDTA